MSDDPESWRSLPVLAELHDQWWKARAGRLGMSQHAYSRDWESLLSDAGLTSAEDRTEAERDVRVLERNGLLRVISLPHRPHLVRRIRIPVQQELRLATLFGDPLESSPPSFDPTAVAWVAELAFLAEGRAWASGDDLMALQRFFLRGGKSRPVVPIKERSLDLFGDEKRLDSLYYTRLFGPGALDLGALRCFRVPEPLGWRRGPGSAGLVLVLENAATWDSFSRWNLAASADSPDAFAAVVYGAGHRFIDGAGFLPEIARETGPIERLLYFGDLDPEGLRIPTAAAARCQELGLPEPEPLTWAYDLLFKLGKPMPLETATPRTAETAWLGEPLGGQADALFQTGHRIAQEWLGWEALTATGRNAAD